MEGLDNREVGGDDKKQGTRYYRMNKKKRERSQGNTTKEEAPPRVLSPDLNSLSSMPTNARILTQEVLHRLPFVYRWSHARVWVEIQSLRSVVCRATASLRFGTVAHIQTHPHTNLHLPTHSHTHSNNNNSEKDVGAIICIVMP